MQRCPAAVVEGVDICAGLGQHRDDLVVGGQVQGCHAVGIAGVGASSSSRKQTRNLGVAFHRSPVERCHFKTRSRVGVSAPVEQDGRNIRPAVGSREV